MRGRSRPRGQGPSVDTSPAALRDTLATSAMPRLLVGDRRYQYRPLRSDALDYATSPTYS